MLGPSGLSVRVCCEIIGVSGIGDGLARGVAIRPARLAGALRLLPRSWCARFWRLFAGDRCGKCWRCWGHMLIHDRWRIMEQPGLRAVRGDQWLYTEIHELNVTSLFWPALFHTHPERQDACEECAQPITNTNTQSSMIKASSAIRREGATHDSSDFSS